MNNLPTRAQADVILAKNRAALDAAQRALLLVSVLADHAVAEVQRVAAELENQETPR
jgi:hypothetical protein